MVFRNRWSCFPATRTLKLVLISFTCCPQMNHTQERFGPDANKEILLLCIGITSCLGRFIFGSVADFVKGANKVFLQVRLQREVPIQEWVFRRLLIKLKILKDNIETTCAFLKRGYLELKPKKALYIKLQST